MILDAKLRQKKIAVPLALMVACLLAFAPSAAAQGSAEDTYGGAGGNIQTSIEGPTADAGDPGALPFTGLDVILMAGGALVLIGVGAGLGRLVAQRQPT